MTDAIRREFRCGAAARWLPRVVAASVLVAAFLASTRIDTRIAATDWGYARHLVVVAGGVVALALVRRGSEVWTVIRLDADSLSLCRGRHVMRLAYGEIEELKYAGSFSVSSHWLPAAVLVDRSGRHWRLCALLTGGATLIAELVERSGRSDLAIWADVLRLPHRLGVASRRVALGYAAAAAILIAAWAFRLGAPPS